MSVWKVLATLVAVLFALGALVACNGAAVLNSITPSSAFDRTNDIAYGPLPRQRLDVYRAVEPREGAPTVVFVHGGGWNSGSKSIYKFIGDSFAMEGLDVVVPDYRLHPDAVYPSVVEDTALAAQWAVEEFSRPVVLVGHSAGGYNALQTVFAPELSAASGLEVCESVAGVVALAAPTGVYELEDEPYTTVFPARFRGDDAPINRARGVGGTAPFTEVPPILLVHGTEDTVVGPRNSTDFAPVLGPRARLAVYEGRDHIDPVRLLSRRFDGDSTLKADVMSFIEGLPLEGDLCADPRP